MFSPDFTGIFPDTKYPPCPSYSRKMNQKIAETIFKHLQMFQYYRDLKDHDKKLKSLWLPHSEMLDKKYIEIDFLKKWDESCGRSNIDNWFPESSETTVRDKCTDPDCTDPERCGETKLCSTSFVKKFVYGDTDDEAEKDASDAEPGIEVN